MVKARPMKRGDVYWVIVAPTMGKEMKGKGARQTRPCVVLSPDYMTKGLGTVTVAPLTSSIRGWPFRQQITLGGKKGEVALDQLRTYDLGAGRFQGYMGKLSPKDLAQCLEKLRAMFTL